MATELEDLRRAAITFPAAPTEYSRAGAAWFAGSVQALASVHHPVLASFDHETVEELPDAVHTDEDSVEYRQFAHSYEMPLALDTILEFDVGTMLAHLDALADDLGAQASRDMLKMISDAATAAGNVIQVDVADPVENLISALEALHVAFDESGDHKLAFVMTPDFARLLETYPPTPEQQARIQAILAAKRKAQNAARGNRRLS